jgi:Tol biopolymer transport system component
VNARAKSHYTGVVSLWAIAATAALLATLLMLWRRAPIATGLPEEVRFGITTPNLPNPRDITISPDGRWIAFPATTPSRGSALFVRRIDSTSPEQLPGTEGAASPFWSPDSRNIAFFAGGRLKKIGVPGGAVQNICSAGADWSSGAWNSMGTVIFSSARTLMRVPATGGEPVRIRALDESRHETAHAYPSFLPDGNHFLFLAWSSQQANRSIYIGSLESNDSVKLFDAQSKAVYAAPGYILFQRAGTLFAQPFDAKTMALTGAVVRVADEIAYDLLSGEAAFNVSANERLVYYAGGGPAVPRQFVWFDRKGLRQEAVGNPGFFTANFDLSPDGGRIAVAQRNPENGQFDIWAIDWARKNQTRLTFDPAVSANGNVVWSPDGARIAFASEPRGNRDIFQKGDVETTLLATANDEWPEDWSKDGKYLVYGVNAGGAAFGDLFALPLFGDRKPFPVAQSPFADDEPRFSFDGKWLAYNSNESGTPQVYVVSFPRIDQKRQISSAGGVQARWRRDGQELYYLGLDGSIMAVEFSDTSTDSGSPRALFSTGLAPDAARDQFAVTPDGQRFLVELPAQDASAVPITVVMNWTASLRK